MLFYYIYNIPYFVLSEEMSGMDMEKAKAEESILIYLIVLFL